MIECALDLFTKLVSILPMLLALYVTFDITALLLFRTNWC